MNSRYRKGGIVAAYHFAQRFDEQLLKPFGEFESRRDYAQASGSLKEKGGIDLTPAHLNVQNTK